MIAELIDCTTVCFGIVNVMLRCHVNDVCHLTYLVIVLRVRKGNTLRHRGMTTIEFVFDAESVLGYCLPFAWNFCI